ncbi:GntP family permease [Arthrobacter sp. zg-ZUI100]|uniref:GntP family permease n=1 Tax=Arthrobacter jiangjiafuii TaxID=2817475 RepID=A0A975M582_9MICC|nr:GntP family permease [Arthrobacter jiangjiafuii]MBP3035705.1 GntP family permease [Arthrobacter jiangjiafuii]MBP3042100.1 GntP family permease [Arthrobacter jiangjiafuii]QWC10122.1 GntP family permease [Arthrobacter jiangjiafuii]
MTIEGWSQTLGAGPLLLIAAGAIALLLFLILKLRLHAFVSLILVSLLTAFATGIPTSSIVTVLTGSFGSTLATVALLVGLGAMLGRLVETSGGAKVLAETLIRVFGEKRAPLALGVASLIFGFPIFFDAGLVVMLPVIFSVARRLGGGVLRYGLPAAGAFSVMHVFVPPHPGPVTASGFFEANIGVVLLLGLVIALPTWYITSYLFGLWVGKKFVLPVPAVLGEIDGDEIKNPPKFGTVVSVLLLPLILIFLNTGLNTLASAGVISAEAAGQPWFAFLRTLGETPVALLISLLVACVVLGTRRGESKTAIEKVLESALGPVCSVILITGAGGMFGGVLRTSGIGDALGSVLSDLGVPLILAGFLIAAILRIAQGSATVALTTAAALIAPGVMEAGYNTVQTATMVLAVAAGSVVVSHVNDSGFWLVGRFMGMDVKTTLKTWTVLETLIGVMGFALAALAFGLASLA